MGTVVTSLSAATGSVSFNQLGNQTLTVDSAAAGEGNVTLSNTGGDLTVTLVDANTAGANGSVTLTTLTSGNVNLGSVTADTGATVTSAGAILESGSDGAPDIGSPTLSLTAPGGIGNAGTLETEADVLTASSTGGNIDLADASSVTLGTGGVVASVGSVSPEVGV